MQAMVLDALLVKMSYTHVEVTARKNGIYTGSTVLSKEVKALDQSQKNEPEKD